MKIGKFLLAGTTATLLAHGAQAEVVNITGSSAFRSAVVRAIQDVMSGEVSAYTGSSLSGGNQQIFVGTIGSTSVTIRTSWNGSVEGVQSVTDPTGFPTNYIPTSASMSAAGTAYSGSLETGVPVMAFSDVYQDSTPVTTPVLNEEQVGVAPFVFVANEGAAITTMTTQLANSLLAVGKMKLSQFTGLAGDSSKTVYVTGRYNGSGTRATTLAEIAYGVFNAVNQYYVDSTGVNGQINGLRLWPNTSLAAPTGGTNDALTGNGGYSSGGGIRDIIGNTIAATVSLKNPAGVEQSTTAGTNVTVVSYLGVGDANNANAAGSVKLTYNGVTYSEDAVKNGYYTFWGYEHILYGDLSTDAALVKDQIVNAIPDALTELGSSAPGIRLDQMAVSRGTDGGLVGPL